MLFWILGLAECVGNWLQGLASGDGIGLLRIPAQNLVHLHNTEPAISEMPKSVP